MPDAMPRRRHMQFSLRTMLVVVAALGGSIAIDPIFPGIGLLLGGAVAWWCVVSIAVVVGMPEAVAGNRQLLRSRRFHRVFWATLPFAAGLSLITYWQTYGAYGLDGYECIGWPSPFSTFGGISGMRHFDYEGLLIDVAVCFSIAAVAGMAMRDGGRRVKIRFLKFISGRT